jgi:hypothetical protein
LILNSQPITWKLSPDKKGLIGNLTIKRNVQSTDAPFSIGFKIVGGQTKPDNTLGAFIDKIKKGSPCETVYHLKCGDEIVEWNSIKFRNLSCDEVAKIIANHKTASQIDLVVERRVVNSHGS